MIKGGIRPDRLRRLLLRLLSIYSPSGKEADIADTVYGYLRRRGLPVTRQEVSEDRDNILVVPPGARPSMTLLGHLDTIPAFDLEDLGPREADGRIHGLGAADMKGGLAALVEAYLCLWERFGPNTPVALALVVGEEELGDGAEKWLLEYPTPWAVIGEPTRLIPCFRHYGYLELQVITHGKMVHASLARPERTAVDRMLRFLGKFTTLLAGHPEAAYNIRDLFTSGSGFVAPDRCETWIDLHLPPGRATADLVREVTALIDEPAADQITLAAHTMQDGYALPEAGDRLADAMRKAFAEAGREFVTGDFPSHSDANHLFAGGVRPLILGPGRLEDAHRPDEWVAFADVEAAAVLYYMAALSFGDGTLTVGK